MTKKETGMELFGKGYNCAQSVAGAFADNIGMSLDDIAKIISPFGGGFGRMREVCGCVSGMCLVLGCLKGYNDPEDTEAKKNLYGAVQYICGKFREETGSVICAELLGLKEIKIDPAPEKRDENYYKKRPCKELVGIACEILENYLNKQEM